MMLLCCRRLIVLVLLVLPLVFATVWVLVMSGPASVEDARSFSMEAAGPHLKDGFSMRSESWSGSLKPGKRKAIRHQLFRGNEYWFWLGSPAPGVKLSVKVYDSKGRPVDVETTRGNHSASARVLAPKTGTYYIVIKAVPANPKEKKEFKRNAVEWAMIYGFR